MKRLVALCSIMATAGCQQSPQAPTSTAAVPVGRYAIVHSPHAESDTTLLDTVTGRTWRLTSTSRGDAWEPMPWPGEAIGND